MDLFPRACRRALLLVALFGCAMPSLAAELPGNSADEDTAEQILATAGLHGGLIVHVGCGDGKLTAALRAGDAYVVQGLDTDAERIAQAREHLRQQGVYGPVSVDRFDGKRLPYADNLVNLVVADALGDVTVDEAMRVLAPGGTLCVKRDGRWQTTVKPRPDDVDVWTHFLHDASGNAVAHDDVVGPPGRLQWTAQPRYMRSHEHVPGLYALVSSGSRIFYIVDEAPIASIKRTPQWHIAARDAFNGTLLWEKPIGRWFPHIVNWGRTPRDLQRRLVAVGDRVYVTLGLCAPLSVLDAATGEPLRVFEGTAGTEEVLVHDGMVLVVVREITDERLAELSQWSELVRRRGSPVDSRDSAEPLVRRLRRSESSGGKSLAAFDADSGRLLWKKSGDTVSGLRTNSLAAEGDRVFCQKGRDVVCLDLGSGERRWSAPCAPLRMVFDGTVYCAGGETVAALSAENGKLRWEQTPLLCDVRDAFVAGGALWLGGFKPYQGRRSGKRGPAWGPYFATKRDLATGEVRLHVEPENPGHHHRCYRNKATDRYILGGRRGTEFIDLDSGEVLWNSWARGVCRYGVMPCNGLVYVPPHACGCYIAAKLTGFNALAAWQPPEPAESEAAQPERGPAYSPPADSPLPTPTDWPTYRHDAGRSGATTAAVPAALHPMWEAALGGRLTSPTVAGGKVFVANVEEHRVEAVDADSGRPLWHFTAGARVDSPPTLHEGRALFGSHDGCVYSVAADDGSLAWRLRAARRERRVPVCGQLESAWPVVGSVLVRDGVVHCTAGRSSYLDGGIGLFRLEAATGKTLSRTAIYSPDPETGRQPKHFAPAFMPGSRADVLSADRAHVYLRDSVFDLQGARQNEGDAHLFALTGFLDDSWTHRSYWIFGTECSISTGCSGRARDLIYGRLLCFDGSTIYGYGRKTVHWSNALEDGPYRLFALKREDREEKWTQALPVHVRALVLAGDVLFAAGSPMEPGAWHTAETPSQEGVLVASSAADGTVLAEHRMACPPIFDGMAAAAGRLYLAMEDGRLVCMGAPSAE